MVPFMCGFRRYNAGQCFIGRVIISHQGAVLQGTFAHKLQYHVAWDATSTSKSELRLKLQTVGVEVFAWEGDRGPPIWCKDEHGKPRPVSMKSLTSI
jgi:hypothetical protein